MTIRLQLSQIYPYINRFYRQFLPTLVTNVGIAGLGAVGGIIAARLLGPDGRGVLAAAIVWSSFLAMFCSLGFPQALTYQAAHEPESVGHLFSSALAAAVLQSFVAIGLGFILIQTFLFSSQPASSVPLQVYLFSIPFQLITTYMHSMAQGLSRFGLFNTIRAMAAAGYVVCLVLVGLLHWHDLTAIMLALLVQQAVVAAIAIGLFATQASPISRLRRQYFSRLLRYGLKSYWSGLFWTANSRVDQLVMSAVLAPAALGLYTVAVSYSTLLFPISGAFAIILFPKVASSGTQVGIYRIQRTAFLNTIISTCGALLLAFAATWLLPFLFGNSFASAIGVAYILLLASIPLGINYVLADGLRGLNLPTIPSFAELIGVLITVPGLLILLPLMGVMGAAWVSLLSYTVVCLLLVIGLVVVARKGSIR